MMVKLVDRRSGQPAAQRGESSLDVRGVAFFLENCISTDLLFSVASKVINRDIVL